MIWDTRVIQDRLFIYIFDVHIINWFFALLDHTYDPSDFDTAFDREFGTCFHFPPCARIARRPHFGAHCDNYHLVQVKYAFTGSKWFKIGIGAAYSWATDSRLLKVCGVLFSFILHNRITRSCD